MGQACTAPAEGSLMRRPLFLACLCLVIAVTIGKILAEADTGDNGGLPPDGSPVRITGRIDTRTSETIILKSISIIQNDQKYSYSGKLQCELTNAQDAQKLRMGQQIIMEGVFSHFNVATNPGEFDARAYYAGKGIGGRVRKVRILAMGEEYSILREKLYGLRLILHDRLARVFPVKEASVMQTLLLGEKEELDAEVKALYQRNGIAHILSISGLHITLLGMGCYRLFKKLGASVRVAAVGGAVMLLLYGVMVGMNVSASRAIGMYLLQMLGIFVGRTYDMLTGIGLLAVLLVLQEPQRLGDVSFFMSFGAVLGICVLTPVFAGRGSAADAEEDVAAVADFGKKERSGGKSRLDEIQGFGMEQRRRENVWNCFRVPAWLRTVADVLGDSAYERNKYREGWRKILYEGIRRLVAAVKSGFSASAGVILFTLPIQLWFFYEIPVYSVLLNLLVLPFMSVVMAGGILSLIPGLGMAGTVDCLILWWYEWISERFEKLPGALWCVGHPAVWQIIVYYSGLFLLIFGRNYAEEWRRRRRHVTYMEEISRRDGYRSGRDRRWKMRRVDERVSLRNREREPYPEVHSGIRLAGERKDFTKFGYIWQERLYENRFLGRIATVIILALFIGLLTGNFDRGSRVIFLDVGQGDGIVVETMQGTYLFDCGSTSRKKVGEYVLKPYLKSRGIRSLRGVFVSHPDEDHMNGVLELLENGGEWGITVEQLFLPAIAEAKRQEAFDRLLAAAELAGVPVSYIKCGDEIRDRQLRLLCLHPEENTTLEDSNAYSECFYVEVFAKKVKWGAAADNGEARGQSGSIAIGVLSENEDTIGGGASKDFNGDAGKLSILLTGDVEGEGERQLTQELLALQESQGSRALQKSQEPRESQESQKSQGSQESQGLQESQKSWEAQEAQGLQEPQKSEESRKTQKLQELQGRGGSKVDILKVAHHGSGYSTSSDFLAAANPTAAIISCGRNNSYGHPHADTLQRLEDAGIPWYLTTDYGAMTITVDDHGNRLRGYLSGK